MITQHSGLVFKTPYEYDKKMMFMLRKEGDIEVSKFKELGFLKCSAHSIFSILSCIFMLGVFYIGIYEGDSEIF